MNAILPEEHGQNAVERDPRLETIRFSQGLREGQISVRKNERGEPCELGFTVNDQETQAELDREGGWINAKLKQGKDLGTILIPKAQRGEDPRQLSLFAILARMMLTRFPPKKQ